VDLPAPASPERTSPYDHLTHRRRHFVLGLGMIALGVLTTRRREVDTR
jgi:hypothetical protein